METRYIALIPSNRLPLPPVGKRRQSEKVFHISKVPYKGSNIFQCHKQLVPRLQSEVVGQPTRRQDAPDKLTGRTRFVGDLSFPGLLHARLVLSPYGHARILSIDTSAAKTIPGVVAVFTAETLKLALATSSSRQQSPLAQKEVFWCGHPVAVVVAESEEAAQDGAFAVEVDYDPLPVVINSVTALEPGSPLSRSRNQGRSIRDCWRWSTCSSL